MPWKETSHERNHIQLRERIIFVASTQKLFNKLPAPRQTFLMTLALLGNTYRKIKLRLHYKKHSLASHHLERQAYIYISLGFSSISKGLIMSKGYCGPHYAMLGLNPSGLICCFNSHPKKKKGFVFPVQNTQNNDPNTTCQKCTFQHDAKRLYYVPWVQHVTHKGISGCKLCRDSVGGPCKQRSQGLSYTWKQAVPGVSYPQKHIQVLF